MARSPHPKKEIEAALRHAESQGWRVEVGLRVGLGVWVGRGVSVGGRGVEVAVAGGVTCSSSFSPG